MKTIWNDYREETREPSLEEIIGGMRSRYGWQFPWYVEFSSNILQKEIGDYSKELRNKAKEKVIEAVKKFETESKQVKFDPVFKGRGFLLENNLCFVLMPLHEPFRRIYDGIRTIQLCADVGYAAMKLVTIMK